MFEKIKRFYDLGLYTAPMVYKFVEKGVITEAQYNEIVGAE
ncbi:MAG: XkdX family protein [Bacteroidales bacterium]|nr:XkdX family protein [Bacteroidales bacterium]